jgi:hypothetical protein
MNKCLTCTRKVGKKSWSIFQAVGLIESITLGRRRGRRRRRELSWEGVRSLALLPFGFTMVAACAVFDASMKTEDATTGTSGADSGGTSGADSGGTSGASFGTSGGTSGVASPADAGEPVYPEACGWILRDGVGTGGCSDPEEVFSLNGQLEQEPNDTKGNPMTKNVAKCGVVKAGGVDVFEFPVIVDQCFHIDVDPVEPIDIDITGPGLTPSHTTARTELPGRANGPGVVRIVLTGRTIDAAYKVAIR